MIGASAPNDAVPTAVLGPGSASFYAEVTRRLDVSPSQILLIGDDWENDVAAPRKFGWQATYLRRDGKPGDSDKSNSYDSLRDAVVDILPA
ncbi:HAD family hydrolase [Rhodopirellula sp. MGV]|uniref:HAD family hydrolase n=1 Tax=Rhodopirellula sp. MGV TaxID=2023130 RepID=UPI000B961F65|nr:HAD hydrolase-like protein [Rhodopirellula sp. MGV]OYP39217.1 hypothetical protein CGZ80_00835 [Rhodopirellula sp. MGV]